MSEAVPLSQAYDYTGSLTQSGRLLSIETPLGQDVLLAEQMYGSETLCELFDFRITVRSKRQDIAPDEIVGLPLSWTLELPGGQRRAWSGVAAALSAGAAVGDGLRSYVVTARPWLWLFAHTSDCRIFQHKTTLQILAQIFDEAGFRDYDFKRVVGQREPRGYCVQYNETDLAFVFRLLEEEGWCWWFRHEAGVEGGPGRHVLVVADGPHAFAPGEEPQLRYTTTNIDLNDISAWTRTYAFRAGAVAEGDWNFEMPRTDLTRTQPALTPIQANRAFELYRWGGRFLQRGRADHVTRRRVEAQETGFDMIAGDSGNRRLQPAQRFTLYGHPLAGENGDYTVISVMHHASDPTYAGGGAGGTPSYANSFTVIPADRPFVPQQRTPRPKIEGVQTATVVGPPGEEIFIDAFGRIQVAFHWDRYARGQDGDSCWIQVCHPSSGDGHGIQIKPRIGMTALISYFEGDPDKPLCIGTAPNPDNPVPYGFPANKSRSTWRSLSHKAKGYTGNNEISMEDDAGRENLFFHAQRDQTTKVRNNQIHRIGGDKAESVGAGKAVTVGGNHKEEIGGSMNLTVGGTGAAAAALAGGLGESSAGLIGQAAGIADGAGGGSPLMGDFAGMVGGSAFGFLAGAALEAQQGMAAGPSSRGDAGAMLAGAGGGLGAAVGKLFPMAGVMNTVVGNFKSDSVGIASHEQVGIAKTANIGQAYVVNVGTELRITVGESSLTMKKDGTVILKGVKFYFQADTHIQATAKIIDLN